MKLVKGADYLTGEYRKNNREPKQCPRCKGPLPIGYPGAVSRLDNETEICSDCGVKEALGGTRGLENE